MFVVVVVDALCVAVVDDVVLCVCNCCLIC